MAARVVRSEGGPGPNFGPDTILVIPDQSWMGGTFTRLRLRQLNKTLPPNYDFMMYKTALIINITTAAELPHKLQSQTER